MPLTALDITAMAAVFAAALAGGLLPMRAARRGGRRFFRLANAFAAGLFLGIGFLHMLPESAEALAGAADYPLAELLALLGLAVLLTIDRVAFAERSRAASLRPWALLAALSIHSLVVGVALGLEPKVAGSLAILSAILFHKASDAFALIVNAHAEGVAASRQKAMLVFFSAVTPAGIAFGSLASSGLGGVGAAVAGGIAAFAAGTLVYVAIVVIVDRELASSDATPPPDKDLWARAGLLFAGVALTAALAAGGLHAEGHDAHDEAGAHRGP